MKKKLLSSMLMLGMLVLLSLPTASAKLWNTDKTEVSPNKTWTIEFNVNMNENQLKSNQYVSVVNENGTPVEVTRTVQGKKLRVSPQSAYQQGTDYSLVIDKDLSSSNGVKMQEEIVMTFTIEKGQEESNTPSAYEQKVLTLVNEERAKRDLAPMTLSNNLSDVARTKAQDMAENGYFSHDSPTYGSPFSMMSEFDISYRAAAENIAAGQRSPEAVVHSWTNSPGHRKNILNESYTHLGIGYVEGGSYGTYWVQMFIQK